MSEIKLYIAYDNNNNIVKFRDTIIESANTNELNTLSFSEMQKSIVVEYKISKNDVCYLNPYSGYYIMTNNSCTQDINKAQMVWFKDSNKWKLKNWSYNDTIINLIFRDITLPSIRIIWCNSSLVSIFSNIYKQPNLDNNKYYINKHFFIHDSINDVNKDLESIIENEKKIIKKNDFKEKKLIITAGSQAAGKSSYFNYKPNTNESIAEYEGVTYYNVDSDRYFDNFTISKKLNNIPFKYTNYNNECVNSFSELTNIFDILKSPHKHIEWTMEQYCLSNNYNFIKQGTSLWLNHMMENPNCDIDTISLHLYTPPFGECKRIDIETGNIVCTGKIQYFSEFGKRIIVTN